MVRQPLRRLVSFYYAWVVNNNQSWCFADQAGEVGLLDHTFREFVETLGRLAERGTPFQHHLTPQTRAEGTVRFDEVVKLEELDQRIVAINRLLGVDYVPRHLNALPYATAKRPDACDLSPRELRREPAYPFEYFFTFAFLRNGGSGIRLARSKRYVLSIWVDLNSRASVPQDASAISRLPLGIRVVDG